MARHFKVSAMLLVNKFDLNIEMTERLEKFCTENGVELAGRLPYDNVTTEAMIAGETVVEHSDGRTSEMLAEIWEKVLGTLNP